MGSRDAPIATQVNYSTSPPIVSSLTSPSSPAGTDFLFQNASSAPTLFVSVGKANSPGRNSSSFGWSSCSWFAPAHFFLYLSRFDGSCLYVKGLSTIPWFLRNLFDEIDPLVSKQHVVHVSHFYRNLNVVAHNLAIRGRTPSYSFLFYAATRDLVVLSFLPTLQPQKKGTLKSIFEKTLFIVQKRIFCLTLLPGWADFGGCCNCFWFYLITVPGEDAVTSSPVEPTIPHAEQTGEGGALSYPAIRSQPRV